MQYFGSNNVGSVTESRVETKLRWVEVGGAEQRLKCAGWRWMELGGRGWSWVHSLIIPNKLDIDKLETSS